MSIVWFCFTIFFINLFLFSSSFGLHFAVWFLKSYSRADKSSRTVVIIFRLNLLAFVYF